MWHTQRFPALGASRCVFSSAVGRAFGTAFGLTFRRAPGIARDAALGIALVSAAGFAQELRGTVLLPDGRQPASGIVAVLLHPTQDDSIVARAVTNDRGRFVLKTKASEPVRLRFLRIGYEALQGGRFTLAAGETRDTTFTLDDVRVRLAAVDVKAVGRCDVQPKGAVLVAQLFEQARTALIASTADVTDKPVMAQFVDFRRQQDRRGRLSAPIQRIARNAATLWPYASVNVDTLERYGYMTGDLEAAEYFAPDANVLISEKFLAHHCLQLVVGTDSLATYIGIAFRPVEKRRDIVDVKGTLWLDRASSELQFLEYSYESLPTHLRNTDLGGHVNYAHTGDGGWFISEWSIQMPLVISRDVDVSTVSGVHTYVSRPSVTGYALAGGAVQVIRQDHEVLYVNARARSVGVMPGDADGDANTGESSSSRAALGAGTPYDGLLTPTRGAAACADSSKPDTTGVLRGYVVNKRGERLSNRGVQAEWEQAFEMNTDMVIRWRVARAEAVSAVDGSYALCGVPFGRSLALAVREGSKWSRRTIALVSETNPGLVVNLTAAETQAASQFPASASASVTSARMSAPTATTGAARELTAPFPTTNRSALYVTDMNGWPVPYAVVGTTGAGTLVGDTAGVIALQGSARSAGDSTGTITAAVYRIGYDGYSGQIAPQRGSATFLLSLTAASNRSTELSAAVTARLATAGFYQRLLESQAARSQASTSAAPVAAFPNDFITPEELVESRNVSLSQLLAARRSLEVTKSKALTVLRANSGCVMALAVNGARVPDVYDGLREELSHRTVDDVVPRDAVLGIEIYGAASSVPPELRPASAGASCGLVVFWTSPG